MPTYAYRGSSCDHEFDTFQKFADAPLSGCTICGGPVRRVVQPVGVVFKGSGWYINDSRKSSTPKSGATDKSETPAAAAATEAKEATASDKSDSKSPAPPKEPAKPASKSAD